MRVALLAGGTGGAKLAAGLSEVVEKDNLSVIANTADDILIHRLHVSPDPDLITYWLAGVIDTDRGWGISGESFNVHDQLCMIRSEEAWFKLGDRDLATCIYRTSMLNDGLSLTEATARIAAAYDVETEVLPMSDDPVTTFVKTEGKWHHFQEYLILQKGEPEIEATEIKDVGEARMTDRVRRSLIEADVIVIGPSNPVASIGPILSLPDMRSLISKTEAPVIAVSPLVEGRSTKGPTEKFMRSEQYALDNLGIADAYDGVIDALISDATHPSPSGIKLHCTDVSMRNPGERAMLAEKVIEFSLKL